MARALDVAVDLSGVDTSPVHTGNRTGDGETEGRQLRNAKNRKLVACIGAQGEHEQTRRQTKKEGSEESSKILRACRAPHRGAGPLVHAASASSTAAGVAMGVE